MRSHVFQPPEVGETEATVAPATDSPLAIPSWSPVANGATNSTLNDDEKHVTDSSHSETEQQNQDGFKEGGYGWVCVVAVFLTNAHTWGLNSSYAVFLAYYLRSDYIPGGSALDYAFVGGLSVAIALLVSPLATVCIGKLPGGTRTTLRIGLVFVTGSFVGASFSHQVWHLLLSQGICFGLGMGFCFTATVGVVPQWFTKRRSFANAISTAGSGFGGLTYSLATNSMITNLGLAWAFRILALVAFVVLGGCSLLVRDRNKAIGAVHVAFHKGLLLRPEFWLFIGWGFFGIISYIIVVFSLTDYAQHVGFTASQGSTVAAVFNLSQGLGRPVIGLVSDRVGRINIAGLGTLMAALAAYFIWIFAGKNYVGLIIYALFGAFAGVIWPTFAPVGAEVVGLQLLPSALSITWIVLAIPSTFAEVIGLSLRKPGINGYLSVQALTATLYIASFISIWLLRSWKLRQMDVLGLTKPEREAEVRNADAATIPPEQGLERRLSRGKTENVVWSYMKGMVALECV